MPSRLTGHRLVRMVVAVAFLLWCGIHAHLPSVVEDWGRLRLPTGVADPIDGLDRRYRALAAWLPARGRVGYLQPAAGGASEAFGGLFVAEYALAPRLVIPGTAAEFVIVPPESAINGEDRTTVLRSADSRLGGFVLYRAFENGVRIFRRFQ
jgi:hypothetical protein